VSIDFVSGAGDASAARRCPSIAHAISRPDYLIVGTGLTGATIAYHLAAAGFSVLAVERRRCVAGNVADTVHPSGIRVQTHGPHYFRTSCDRLWNFVRRFGQFFPYHARVLSLVDGRYEHWPVTASYIARRVGYLPPRGPASGGTNFESAMLSIMPREVFEGFVKEYTEKQWGCAPHQLDAALARRVEIRWDDDPRLTPNARYQGLPTGGYSALIERMLDTIPVLLGVDYLSDRELFRPRRLTIFTGAIDEYFGFELGRLHYRAQRRSTSYQQDSDYLQPVAQVNDPQHAAGSHIRTIEWKHLMRRRDRVRIRGTVLTRETPYSPIDPDQYEYPFPDETNRSLYDRYRTLASTVPETLICGRLGEYRYYDMDQAIARAMMLAQSILKSGGRVAPPGATDPARRSPVTAGPHPDCRSA
jgi:UDP-galactopyranose mutase